MSRALERAYKQGFADAQDPRGSAAPVIEPAVGPLEWGVIPPRPRNAFWSCCLFILGRRGGRHRPGHLEPALTERGTLGWRLVVEGYERELKELGLEFRHMGQEVEAGVGGDGVARVTRWIENITAIRLPDDP